MEVISLFPISGISLQTTLAVHKLVTQKFLLWLHPVLNMIARFLIKNELATQILDKNIIGYTNLVVGYPNF